jgi:subtilisin family serine protease/subtilisin-like proprotein convertase family protein
VHRSRPHATTHTARYAATRPAHLARLARLRALAAAAGALVLLAALALVVGHVPSAGAQELAGPTIGPLLDRALADPLATMRQDDGTLAVWVFFRDRGRDAAELRSALDAVRAELPARTLARRAKMLTPGQSPVDARDLSPAADYVAAVTATGADLRRESRWLNAVSVDATDAQIAAIAGLPFVREVELVAKFRKREPGTEPTTTPLGEADVRALRDKAAGRWTLNYGGSLEELEQINVPPVHELGYDGEGVIIGMLDSGFKTTHVALAGIPVLARYDFINDDEVVENEPGDPSSQHSHGTKTMSTVMGFAEGELVGPAHGASAILAKTEDVSQEVPIEEDNWVAGLEWVESLGADVVSSSLGYYAWYDFADLDGNTAVTTIAADLAVGRGLVVVNSAGNERGFGFGHIIAPADGDSVIAVGAVTDAGDIASFSSPGPSYDGRIKPDVSALGVGNHVVRTDNDEGYITASGTSFACPLISGVAALVLQRAPQLTPLQVREALRETADRAADPDNDFGWGIVDALAAVTYWGATIDHAPLGDTEDETGPYVVAAQITDRLPLDPSRMHVDWRVDGGAWLRTPLIDQGGDLWQAEIPGQPAGTLVEYAIAVTDSADITTMLPTAGTDAPFGFVVGPDTTAPVLVHTPLGDQPVISWPPSVVAEATDNLGIDRVELTYTQGDGMPQGPVLLAAEPGSDLWTLDFPVPVEQIAVGDTFTYTLTAWDAAQVPSSMVSGPHTFAVIDVLGVVLVVDDGGSGLVDLKVGADKALVPPRSGKSAAGTIAGWLADAGYAVDQLDATAVAAGSFDGYQAVVYSAGSNTATLDPVALRTELVAWAQAGGRLFVEGGEVGYDVLTSPGYPDIAASVLRAVDWDSDDAGALQTAAGQQDHPLLQVPNVLPASIPVAYGGYGDQDAVVPDGEAVVVLGCATRPELPGLLAYDDNPAPQAGQIVYLAANVEALDPVVGRQLTENALAYLLASEGPATASIAGTVSLIDGEEPSGVTVSVGPQNAVTTGPDGAFLLDGLYGGTYTLTAEKEGYATSVQEVTVADGEALTGLEVSLLLELELNYAVQPELPIPDANGAGITSTIDVTDGGTLAEITVDIDLSHTFIGDLRVLLTSPDGTTVTLHNRSGGSSDDIVGNWPLTLNVDGPGALDDLLGESIGGDWTLRVIDSVGGDSGTLHSWGLNMVIPAGLTAAGDVPVATRLLGARPNPFNPRTTVAFDLARGGEVELAVFDLRGRLVRRLVDGELPAGAHRVRWDGRDASGRESASGVYLVRLIAPDARALQKMTLVR